MTTTTSASAPEHFPRYCVMCQTGMWDGYLCEGSADAYCGLECAAADHGMTAQQLAADLEVWAAADYSAETEPVVYWTDWRDIDPADYDDMPEPADDPHEEFDAHEVEGTLIVDSPSGRLSVTADDRDARQLFADVGITLAEGSR
jgi:hypothetical protein